MIHSLSKSIVARVSGTTSPPLDHTLDLDEVEGWQWSSPLREFRRSFVGERCERLIFIVRVHGELISIATISKSEGFLEELHCFVLSNVVLSVSCNLSQTSSLLFSTLPSKLSNSAFSYIFWVSSSSKTSLLISLYVCFETSVKIVLLQLPA